MKFTPNPNYVPIKASMLIAGYPTTGPIKIEFPWNADVTPSCEEIDNYCWKILNPGDAMIMRDNLYRKYYNRSTFSSLVYNPE